MLFFLKKDGIPTAFYSQMGLLLLALVFYDREPGVGRSPVWGGTPSSLGAWSLQLRYPFGFLTAIFVCRASLFHISIPLMRLNVASFFLSIFGGLLFSQSSYVIQLIVLQFSCNFRVVLGGGEHSVHYFAIQIITLFSFVRNCQISFELAFAFPAAINESSFNLHFCQHLVLLLLFWILAILIGMHGISLLFELTIH